MIEHLKIYIYIIFHFLILLQPTGQVISFKNEFGSSVKLSEVIISNEAKKDTFYFSKKSKFNSRLFPNFDSISVVFNDTIISKSNSSLKENSYEFIITTSITNALPIFETSAIKKSFLPNGFNELNHQVINQQQIQNSNTATSAELLLLSPFVTIQKSSFAGGSPILRGFEANRVLLIVDGVRMNNAIYRGGHLQNSLTIDPFIIENCDVIFGPSAVTYGSDAIGGVVHYRTKRPLLNSLDSTKFSGIYFARLNSACQEVSNHIDFSLAKSNTASLTSISYKRFGDVSMGQNRHHGFSNWGLNSFNVNTFNFQDSIVPNNTPSVQVGFGYNQIDLMNKILFKINSKSTLLINSQFSNSSSLARYDQLNNTDSMERPQFSKWNYGPQKRVFNMMEYASKSASSIFDFFNANLSHQFIEESRITRRFNSLREKNQVEQVNIFGANVQFSKKIKLRSTLVYGAELYFNNVNSNAFSLNIQDSSLTIIDSRYPDAGAQTFFPAIFANLNIKKPNYSIIGGVRYTWNDVYASYSSNYSVPLLHRTFNINKHSINGSLNTILYPSKSTKILLELSTGFRAPNIDDLGKTFIKDNSITVPNNNLIPEYAYNTSLGISKKLDLVNLSLAFSSSAFITILENTVIKSPLEVDGSNIYNVDGINYSILANQNGPNSLVTGASTSLEAMIFTKLKLASSICYTKGKTIATNLPLGHIPPIFGKINFSYSLKKFEYSVVTLFNGNKELKDFGSGNVDNQEEATAVGYPSWWVIDAQLNYKHNDNIVFNIRGCNLLDIHYKTFGSGISSPGRSLMFSVKLVL